MHSSDRESDMHHHRYEIENMGKVHKMHYAKQMETLSAIAYEREVQLVKICLRQVEQVQWYMRLNYSILIISTLHSKYFFHFYLLLTIYVLFRHCTSWWWSGLILKQNVIFLLMNEWETLLDKFVNFIIIFIFIVFSNSAVVIIYLLLSEKLV